MDERLVIDPEETRRRRDEVIARDGHGELSMRLERVCEMERQLLGLRDEQYSCIAPPAFFVCAYGLDADGAVDWCEPFFMPEVCDIRGKRTPGKVRAPAGTLSEALREPCPHCGRPAYVVGEYYHDIQPLTQTWFIMRLFLYCRDCPAVSVLSEFEQRVFDLESKLRGCKR